jgi:hypothetical protein
MIQLGAGGVATVAARVTDLTTPGTSAWVLPASDPLCPNRLLDFLRSGRPVLLFADRPGNARSAKSDIAGQRVQLAVSSAYLAAVAGVPCVPVAWQFQKRRLAFTFGPPSHPRETSVSGLARAMREVGAFHSQVVSARPSSWMSWCALSSEWLALRKNQIAVNDQLWKHIADGDIAIANDRPLTVITLRGRAPLDML